MMHTDAHYLVENQISMISSYLKSGYSRSEIISLCEFDENIFDTLEKNSAYKKIFAKCETEAFINDLDHLKSNLNSKTFNHQAATLYFINRYGWSTKASKSSCRVKTHSEIIEKVCAGTLDAEVALLMLKAIELSQDITYKKEERLKINSIIEKIEKYQKEHNLK